MGYVHKLFQLGVKLFTRLPLYVRGLSLFLKIHMCGGVCATIPRVEKGFVLRYPPHSGLRLGKSVRIGPNCMIECPVGALLEIGDNVGLTAGVIISSHHSVHIGNNSLIAEWVSIRDAEHSTSRAAPIGSQPLRHGAIRIEDDVWIGKGSIVLQGSIIGHGCVLGANSFFKNRSAEAFGIYAGAPAIKIKSRMP